MRYRLLGTLLALSISCTKLPPPVIQPPVVTVPPPAVRFATACVAMDEQRRPIIGATCVVDDQVVRTNQDGYALLPEGTTAGDHTLTVSAEGFLPAQEPFVMPGGDGNLRVTLIRPFRRLPPLSDEARPNANFGSMLDEHGRLMLSWFYPLLDAETQAEWERRWKAEGLNTVVLCPVMQYRDYWVGKDDWRGQPERFGAVVRQLIDRGFYVWIMGTSGDGGTASDFKKYWPGLAAATADLNEWLIVAPGFESCGRDAGHSAAETSVGLYTIKALWPKALVAIEFTPTRWTCASYPVQLDDPWQGDEAGFGWSHGGEILDIVAYETDHGDNVLRDLTMAERRERTAKVTTENAARTPPLGPYSSFGGLWPLRDFMDRWQEGAVRWGCGTRGWRKIRFLSFFESTEMDQFRGRATPADAKRAAQLAKQVVDGEARCEVRLIFGSGVP